MKKKFFVLTLGAAMMMGMAVHADGEKTVVNFYEHQMQRKFFFKN